jgi:hypothetical protein
MAHGGYGKRRVAERKPPVGRRSKGLGGDKKPKQKPKSVSLKNQIRSVERMLRKVLTTFQLQISFLIRVFLVFNLSIFHLIIN